MNVDAYGQVKFDNKEILEKTYLMENQSVFGFMNDLDEIAKWNENCSHFDLRPINTAQEIDQDPMEYHSNKSYAWKMPVEFLNFDPIEYCSNELIKRSINKQEYIDYLINELKSWEKIMTTQSAMNLFRFLHYLIQTCEKNNIVTGVGRGSSVSSLILFLLGVHHVDPVKYNLDYNEFLR